MSVGADEVLATTRKLLPQIQRLWLEDHPLMKVLFDDIKTEDGEGEYTAFDVEVGEIGESTQIVDSNETYSYVGGDVLKQGLIYIPTVLHSFKIPGAKLRKASGANGIANLVKLYPENAMHSFKKRMLEQFLVGNTSRAADVNCFFTLNGDRTWRPLPTQSAQQGALRFEAQSAQTLPLFGLNRHSHATDPTTGWYNQFGTITSFATNGKAVMRQVYDQCEARGGSAPTQGWTTQAGYLNYYSSLDDQVRIVSSESDVGDGEKGNMSRKGLAFHDSVIRREIILDDLLSNFTSATDGLLMFLNPSLMFSLKQGKNNDMETDGKLQIREQGKLEGQDAWGYEWIITRQVALRNLKGFGVIKGMNNP